jgi:hypothetical protein
MVRWFFKALASAVAPLLVMQFSDSDSSLSVALVASMAPSAEAPSFVMAFPRRSSTSSVGCVPSAWQKFPLVNAMVHRYVKSLKD